MKNSNKGQINTPVYQNQPVLDSRYEMSKKEKATPYYLSYLAAWQQRPYYEDPVEIVRVYPKPRRTAFVVIILILMLAVLALSVVSFLNVVPELALFERLEGEIETEDGVEVVDKATIAADDIIYGTLKSFSLDVEGDWLFYTDALRNADNVELPVRIAYYAIPASFALTVILATYVIIKAIIALTNPKRRKFSYILLITMLFSLLGVAGGFVWNAQPAAEIVNYITRSGTHMILGFGYIGIIALEVLAIIASLFSYRSKRKTGGK